MNSIFRIYVPSTLNVAAQHTEVLTVTLDPLQQNVFSVTKKFVTKSPIFRH